MFRAIPAMLFGVLVLAGAPAAQPDPAAGADLVELDVAVVDGKGRPVTGLTQLDFSIKEDGKPVAINTFSETVAENADAPRSIVLLMDDAAVPAMGNQAMQTIARAFVSSADPFDEVSVVRLHSRADEPFGDRRVAEFRIAEYQAGSIPFTDWVTPQEMLRRVADLSRQMASDDRRRKIVVCIGAPVVCNIEEPATTAPRQLWSTWVNALAATARANVAVYAVVPGQAMLRGGGLVDYTGGEVFATTYDVGPAIDRILRDASNYYMLGYWPESKARELHSIEVKVSRKGAKVHARRKRGL